MLLLGLCFAVVGAFVPLPAVRQSFSVARATKLFSTVQDGAQAKPEPAEPPAAADSPVSRAAAEAQGSLSDDEDDDLPAGPCPRFPKCDGAMRGKGCDGSGIIQGGLATMPGLGWWPIKVGIFSLEMTLVT
jgi:hypothetical protein